MKMQESRDNRRHSKMTFYGDACDQARF